MTHEHSANLAGRCQCGTWMFYNWEEINLRVSGVRHPAQAVRDMVVAVGDATDITIPALLWWGALSEPHGDFVFVSNDAFMVGNCRVTYAS